VLVFAVTSELNLVALLVKPTHHIPLVDILLHEASKIEANGDYLLMGNLVLQLAVNKVQHILLTKYPLNLLAIVLPHYQQVRRTLYHRLVLKHFSSEPHIVLQQEQPHY
jgi:hypothetical protein